MSDERITADELAYHERLVERVKWAQQAQVEISTIDGAFRSWGEHLHAKYKLGEGDGVDESGVITRTAG
jgi:hypothetical protein